MESGKESLMFQSNGIYRENSVFSIGRLESTLKVEEKNLLKGRGIENVREKLN